MVTTTIIDEYGLVTGEEEYDMSARFSIETIIADLVDNTHTHFERSPGA